MSQPPTIVAILYRYSKRAELTEQETKILADWLDRSEANQLLFDEMSDTERWAASIAKIAAQDEDASWLAIERRIEALGGFKRPVIGWKRFAAAAAVLLLLLGLAELAVRLRKRSHSPQHPDILVAQRADIITGNAYAVLTLGHGSPIPLNPAAMDSLGKAKDAGIEDSAGSLAFTTLTNVDVNLNSTLTTPKGTTFQLRLSDGTKVWLNTASSLTYPRSFTKVNREVALTGEAYFEVAKDAAHPFLVKTDQATVQVLGTHFDVAVYEGFRTFLFEGKVTLQSADQTATLYPGENGDLVQHGQFLLSPFDTSEVSAWRNNNFFFKNASYESIMKELARWYPMTVSFEGSVKKHFTGILPRDRSLRSLLNILEGVGYVSFSIQQNHVTVKAL